MCTCIHPKAFTSVIIAEFFTIPQIEGNSNAHQQRTVKLSVLLYSHTKG